MVGEIKNLTIKEKKSETTVEATISNPNSDQKNQKTDNQEVYSSKNHFHFNETIMTEI